MNRLKSLAFYIVVSSTLAIWLSVRAIWSSAP